MYIQGTLALTSTGVYICMQCKYIMSTVRVFICTECECVSCLLQPSYPGNSSSSTVCRLILTVIE